MAEKKKRKTRAHCHSQQWWELSSDSSGPVGI